MGSVRTESNLMNKALIDYYRCPGGYLDFALRGSLSKDIGFFRFGHDTICYGQSSAGFCSPTVNGHLDDVFQNAVTEESTNLLPFDPTQIIDNLRFEYYVPKNGKKRLLDRFVRNAYYGIRPLLPVPVRRHLQRVHLRDWSKLSFPHWPVDRSVEQIVETLLKFSVRSESAATGIAQNVLNHF